MASAENSVQIKVSFNHQEQVLPLTIRPSLELTDLKVDAAEDELDQALRRAFDIQEDDTFYLHEAESGRILTKETFRDPGYCSSFPTHWYLVVERREKDKTGSDEFVVSERITKEEELAMNHSNVEREMASMFQLGEGEERGDVDDEEYSDSHERNGGVELMNGPSFDDELLDFDTYGFHGDDLLDNNDVICRSLADLSPTTDNKYQSHTLHCNGNGEFGFTIRHFSIQPNASAGARSGTPHSDHTHSRSDSMASTDSFDTFRLTTTFIYHITPGGVANGAGLEVGLAIQQINGESILRSSGEEIQQLLEQCGEEITLLVLPKDDDDLQCLYPHYTYGVSGSHMTTDGLTFTMDMEVTRGTGELENHTPSLPNNQLPNNVNHLPPRAPAINNQSTDEVTRKAPLSGLVPFVDDGSQELSLGIDNVHASSSSGDFTLLTLHEMATKTDPESTDYHAHRYNDIPLTNGDVASGNNVGRTGKKGLEFTPPNLDLISEDAPANHLESKWYSVSDEPYLDHSLAQEGTGKVENTQSSMSDNNYVNSSPPIETRARTRSQSSLIQKASSSTCSSETHLVSRAGLTGSMSALDYLSLGKRSHSTELGNIRIKRKGRNSLEALTKLGVDLQPLGGGSGTSSAIKRHRSDENTHRVRQAQQLRSATNLVSKRESERPSWLQQNSQPSTDTPSNPQQSNKDQSSSTQLTGRDHHGSAPRLAHTTSVEGKGRRVVKSYRSQRAKLHSSRSAIKISGSQDLTDSLDSQQSRSRRSVDRSDTSLEGSASQDRSIQSDETLVGSKASKIPQPVLRVEQVEQQISSMEKPHPQEVGPGRVASIGRHSSLKDSPTSSPVTRGEGGKKNRPLSAVDANQFRLQASSAQNQMIPTTNSFNRYGQGNDPKIPLYKTRSAQTPYGTQVVREVNIEEAIARSQMTQEMAESEAPPTSTFEPTKKEYPSNHSRRKEFARKNARSVDISDPEPRNLMASPLALRLSNEVLSNLGLGDNADRFRKEIKCHGLLMKKLDLTESGKRAPDRSWKQHYSVLAGDKLLFYKDKKDAQFHKPSDEPPIDVVPSTTTVESNSKKKFVFRIVTAQGAEFLLQADDATAFSRWVTAIQRLNIGQTLPNESVGTLQRPESSNKLAPNSPLMQRRSSSPQPQKTKKKDFMNRLRRVLTGQRPGDEPDSSSFITFGTILEDCPVSADNKRVPLVVEFCVKEVEENGLEVEGIYRRNGQVNLTKSMSAEMDKGNYEFSDYGDIHTVGSLLKKFFKELPDPAIPVHLYDEFVTCVKESDEEERLESLKKNVYQLPTAHYHTLKYLMRHLKKVAGHSDKNKMTYRNVSIVFGPTLLFKPESAQDVLSNMNASYTVVQLLCQHVEYLFESELCGEEQRIQEEATEQMRLREEEVATRGSPTISRHSETKIQKDQRLAKASPQLVRRIRNNLGSSERVSNGRLYQQEGMKRNSFSVESHLQPKQPNWSNQSRAPSRRISDEYHGAPIGGVANQRQQQQQDRRSRVRRPHVYEDVESPENTPVVPVVPVLTDSHARTRSWVESHTERLWSAEEVERSDSAEGHRHGDRHGDRHGEPTGSIWASRNRDGQQPRGGGKERRQPRMTRLGRGHLPTAYAPPPMTVESDVITPPSFHHGSRTVSLPSTHLPGMPHSLGGGASSRRVTPPSTSTPHKPGSKRISYGMAVGISPVDLPDKDVPIRDPGRPSRREGERHERFSSSDHYSTRMRARAREEAWQTEGYGSRSHTHQGHTHSMYARQYNSLQRQMSPPTHQPHHYQSSRRSSESSGDGYGGGSGTSYVLQDSSGQGHFSRYSGSHGGSRGRIPQRTFSNDLPQQRVEGAGQRVEGAGPNPIPNRESYL